MILSETTRTSEEYLWLSWDGYTESLCTHFFAVSVERTEWQREVTRRHAKKRTQFRKQILVVTRHARRHKRWRKKSQMRKAKKILNQKSNRNCGEKHLGEGQCVAKKSVNEITSMIRSRRLHDIQIQCYSVAREMLVKEGSRLTFTFMKRGWCERNVRCVIQWRPLVPSHIVFWYCSPATIDSAFITTKQTMLTRPVFDTYTKEFNIFLSQYNCFLWSFSQVYHNRGRLRNGYPICCHRGARAFFLITLLLANMIYVLRYNSTVFKFIQFLILKKIIRGDY